MESQLLRGGGRRGEGGGLINQDPTLFHQAAVQGRTAVLILGIHQCLGVEEHLHSLQELQWPSEIFHLRRFWKRPWF